MMNKDLQTQESGDDSKNYQGGRDVTIVNNGITYRDAKDIATDVFNENFMKLKNEANETARIRAEEVTNDLLNKMKEDDLKSFKEPSMQLALYEAQKAYVKTGDKSIEEMLVDLLAERAKEQERTLKQIVLDESLNIMSKINVQQMNILSILFMTYEMQFSNLLSYKSLLQDTKSFIIPLLEEFELNTSSYDHLNYLGCTSHLQFSSKSLEEILILKYPKALQKKITKKEYIEAIGQGDKLFDILMELSDDLGYYIFNTDNSKNLKKACIEKNIDISYHQKIENLYKSKLFKKEELKIKLLEDIPELNTLYDMEKEGFLLLKLTTVGKAIAYANIKRQTDLSLDLNIWIK